LEAIHHKYAVLDFETTGPDSSDRIIQVGLAVIEEGQISHLYSSYINPGMPIPDVITRLTGITDEDVADAPELDEVLMEMLPLLDGAALVAHNALFDLGFLQRSLIACGYEPFSGRVLDTLEFLRFLYPGLPSLSLGRASALLGVHHEQHHRADSDADATARIWLMCLERLRECSLSTLRRLVSIFGTSPAYVDIVWQLELFVQTREHAADEIEESAYVYRHFKLGVTDWTEDDGSGEPIDATFSSGGFEQFYEHFKPLLKNKFEQYEERDAQSQMIHEVYEAMSNSNHLMVEAGTGTGKSLGYLIPSIYFSVMNQEKVVISTQTINLQEQLRTRDIPLLQELFPFPIQAAVLKGRRHYLCLRKFEHKIHALDFENPKEDPLTAAQMVTWLETSQHGDNEELQFSNKGGEFWRTVESDTDSCLNSACPWFKKCFYHRSRKEANQADIVITNHSLLFTDVKAENRLLPAYQYLVIDEAHQFEETASKHLGTNVNYNEMVSMLQRIYKDSFNGILPQLIFRLGQEGDDELSEAIAALEQTIPELINAKEGWDRLVERLFQLLLEHSESNQGELQLVWRMKRDMLPSDWGEVQELESDLHIRLTDIIKTMERAFTTFKDKQEQLQVQGLVVDLNGTLKDLGKFRDDLRFILACNAEDYVYWLEGKPMYRNRSLQLNAVPIDVSEMLHDHFFESKESVILTSATLSVDKSFDYASEQLGLGPSAKMGKLKTVQLPSVFNYRKQALVCIPRDFPSVRGNADIRFIEALADSLTQVALATNGRMLVLFTSYKMLKQTYELMQQPLEAHGVTLLGQGMDSTSRSKLVRLFQDEPSTVLLGTSSFWEGVDIPGQALTCLAIVRLPFQPPNHPVVEAKNDAIKRQNKNPFMKLSVPGAVIRFKQGFGRLVRTASDKGIVLIYDTRVIDTAYGKYFLYSLPGPKIEHLPSDQLVPRIQEWLKDEGE
jgi:ATP-dependent DNA helicase DinG